MCFPERQSSPRQKPRLPLTCKSAGQPTSTLSSDPAAKETWQQQMPGQRLWELGRKWVLRRIRKGWERSRRISCGRPNPATAPAVCSPPCRPFPPSLSFSVLSLLGSCRRPHTFLFAPSNVRPYVDSCVTESVVTAESSKR